jgi:hypothetical protein
VQAKKSIDNISGRTWYRAEKTERKGAQHKRVNQAGNELRAVNNNSRKVAVAINDFAQISPKAPK